MRFQVFVDDQTLSTDETQDVEDRFRWALGSYVAEVVSAELRGRRTPQGVKAEAVARLRSGRQVSGHAIGSDVLEALRFAAQRIGAAVARHHHLERILGG